MSVDAPFEADLTIGYADRVFALKISQEEN